MIAKGRVSINEIQKERIILVNETSKDKFIDEHKKEWSMEEINSHRKTNSKDYFICLCSINSNPIFYSSTKSFDFTSP